MHSLDDPTKIPVQADPDYGHVIDTSGGADEDYDAQINALMDDRTPLSFGPSSSGAKSSSLSGGYTTYMTAAAPSAKAMPKSSTSTTRPCPTSQGGQSNKMRKIQDVMKELVSIGSYTFYKSLP